MNLNLIKALPMLLLVPSVFLKADVIPGRWEKADGQPSGKPIIVTLKTRDRIEGTFKNSGVDYLTVVTAAGGELRIAKPEVGQIVSGEKHEDGILDGTLIGLAAGFAGGAAVGGAVSERVDLIAKFTIPFFGGLGAGVGALVGYLADRSHEGTEILYRARQ